MPVIKEELRRQGLPVSGSKRELIRRLDRRYKDLERNRNIPQPIDSNKVLVIKRELRSLGLSTIGRKVELVRRLEERYKESQKVRLEVWQLRYKAWESRMPLMGSTGHESFPQFSRLPMEIQVMIWELTFVGSDVIKFYSKGRGKFALSRPAGNPVALLVNQASRDIALKRYRLVFGSSHIYANLEGPDCDVLDLCDTDPPLIHDSLDWASWSDYLKIPVEGLRSVWRIALRIPVNDLRSVWGASPWAHPSYPYDLSEFQSLQEVFVVMGGTDSGMAGQKGVVVLEDAAEMLKKDFRGENVEWWDARKSEIQRDMERTRGQIESVNRKLYRDIPHRIPKLRFVLANRKLFAPWDEEDAPVLRQEVLEQIIQRRN